MSRETLNWLNSNTLIGFGHKAWHFSQTEQGAEPNHYPHAIPAEDVTRRLFSWTAQPTELSYTHLGDEGVTTKTVPGHVANVRSDNGEFVGMVSKKYGAHQFDDSLRGGAEKITGSGLGISSAGLLKGGAVGWVSVSLADTVLTPQGVEFLPYLMCYGSHDGSLPTGYKRVCTNVVCDNTMSMALGEKKGADVRIRHTRHSQLAVENAQVALGLITATGDTFAAQVAELCEITVTNEQWSTFLKTIVPIEEGTKPGRSLTMAENKRGELNALWTNDRRVTPWKNTGWGVVQAVNTYTHHMQTVRGTTRGERNMLGTLDGSWDALDATSLSTLQQVLQSA